MHQRIDPGPESIRILRNEYFRVKSLGLTSDVGLGEGRLWWRLVGMWFRAFLVLGESLV